MVRAWILGVIVVVACTPRSNAAPSEPEPCAKLGQSCVFAPGKLGACVEKPGCEGAGCFVGQSQHGRRA